MLETLCRKLTLLFGLLTAAVLGAALAVTCRMAQNEARAASDLLYANTISSIEDTVTGSGPCAGFLACPAGSRRPAGHHGWRDNGLPLAFPGGWAPADDRAALLAAARQQAAAAGLDPAPDAPPAGGFSAFPASAGPIPARRLCCRTPGRTAPPPSILCGTWAR